MKRVELIEQVLRQALPAMGFRADAGETAMYSRSLEHIQAQVVEQRFAEIKFRALLPVDNSPHTGADIFTYRQVESFGEAKIISSNSDELPSSDVKGAEYSSKILGLGAKYSYSVQDLRAAALSGVPLDSMRAMAARMNVERKMDYLACFGDSASGLGGFSNASNIASETITTKTTSNAWAAANAGAGATAAEVAADVGLMFRKVFTGTKGVFAADTLALPTNAYSYIMSTPVALAFGNTMTVGSYLMAQNPWLKSIEHWAHLDTAGTGPTTRALCYKKDPQVLKCVIPQEFEQFPPQAQNLSFMVPCHARFGGVVVFHPKAVCYMDGV